MKEAISAKFREIEVLPLAESEFKPFGLDELAAIEHALNADLPADYREFLLEYGAVTFAEYVDFIPLMPLPDSVADRGVGHFSHFYGAKSAEYDITVSLSWNIATFKGGMPTSVIPIGSDGGGNQICLGIAGSERDQVYLWTPLTEIDEEDYLDQNETPMPSQLKSQNLHPIAHSFSDFIQRLEVSKRL